MKKKRSRDLVALQLHQDICWQHDTIAKLEFWHVFKHKLHQTHAMAVSVFNVAYRSMQQSSIATCARAQEH